MAYTFEELVDLKRITALMQLFYELTGFASALIDLDGNILRTEDQEIVGSGWNKICLNFHRVHPETARNCTESDLHLWRKVNEGGRAACYTCLNGLGDAASQVVIDGHHIGNLFIGQFLCEPPDEDFFRRRARELGFDEQAYLEALKEIKVFPRAFVDKALAFLDMLAGILAESGLKQKHLLEINEEIEARIRERTAELLAANTELSRAKEALERREAELARLNARLRDLDSAKTEFFSNVSHEFRTPLTLILGPIERLLAGPGLDEAQRRALEVVRKNAYTLLKHVNDLLDVTKLDAGRMTVDYRSGDLAETVRMVAGHFEALAPERGIGFEVSAPDRLPAQFDPDKIERIALNLLANAFKFTPAGGRVRCTVAAADGEARIRVEDTGPGISPQLRDVIFERFRQGEAGPTRRFGGTGLGLAIAKDFAQLHGGTIGVREAPGGGALFEVALPLAAPPGAVVEAAPQTRADPALPAAVHLGGAPAEGAPLRTCDEAVPPRDGRPLALVVEDNPELRRFIAEALGQDFAVVTAGDGAQGLATARELRPDVVVTDIMMPVMSGDQMVAALRAEGPEDEPPVLVLTAKADEQLRVNLLRSGAQDYLVKPFLAEELRVRAANLAKVKRTRDILQAELQSRDRDIARLAAELAAKNRTLQRSWSEMKVAREQAEAASRAKSRFLAMVSHELRSPLQNFELYLELLKGTMARQPGQHGRLDMLFGNLSAASARMGRLVTTILQHSSIEGGRLAVNASSFDLAALADEVVGELAPRAGAKGLRLTVDAAPGLPPLVSDPNLVRVVLVNLVDNAVKYTREGGVAVALGWTGDSHRCTVTDTGIGIRPADTARIFEPFHQCEDIDHKHTEGVGLGLSLVKNVVEMLGGGIELVSEPGRGSAFTVDFPPLPESRSCLAC